MEDAESERVWKDKRMVMRRFKMFIYFEIIFIIGMEDV